MLLFAAALCAEPATRADKALTQAIEAERAGNFDKAYDLIRAALRTKPGDIAYQLEGSRIRFEYAAYHVRHAVEQRSTGKLKEALEELEKARTADPSSAIAADEIRRTRQMIESPGPEPGLTPVQQQKKQEAARIAAMQPLPELKPLTTAPINLIMTNRPKVLFDTVGRLAGINVIFDPDYDTQNPIKQSSLEVNNSTLQQALDYLAMLTRSYWKPISSNAIFVTLDNRQKRQDYEDQVVKVFYLTNVTQTAELNEAVSLLRTVADIQKVFISTPMNAIVVRAEADKVRLAEKVIAAIDKPKSEVMVDVMVMEVNRTYMRNLSAAFGASGINSNIVFTPRSSIAGASSSGSSTSSVLVNNVKRISTGDYTVSSVPGALVEALLSDSGTRLLQAPQIRTLDNIKATLRVGEKVPTASGSYSNAAATATNTALVSTQFTYLDVGVNLDLLARVHDANEVTLHLGVEVSQVTDHVSIGGIDEPEIGQRRFEVDLRMHDGEVNLIGGLTKREEDKTTSGIPGLSQIPFLKRLFSTDNVTRTDNELLITVIPHIVRAPSIDANDLREVATGAGQSVKLTLKP